MKTLLLMTVLFAAMILPVIAARDPDPRRGLARLLVMVLAFDVVYVLYLTQVHPVAFVPHWP